MAKRVVRELALFAALFLVLALVWHPDLLSDPSARMERLAAGQASLLHPLLWTGGAYLLLGFFRLLFSGTYRLIIRIKSLSQ